VIHLDANFLIRALVRGSAQDSRLRLWLRAGEPLSMSAIAWTEFLCGPVDHPELELALRVVPERISFTEEDAAAAARLFNEGGRRRGTLVDAMIAATAIRQGASLATQNPRDFRPFEKAGLTIITV